MFDDESESPPIIKNIPDARIQQSKGIPDATFSFDQSDADLVAARKRAPPGSADVSKFSNSIAAALDLKDKSALESVTRKLKRERLAERHNPELVERDLSVGIFVTKAYKKILRKQDPSAPNAGSDSSSDDEVSSQPMKQSAYYDNLVLMRTEASFVGPPTIAIVDSAPEYTPALSSAPIAKSIDLLSEQHEQVKKKGRYERSLLRLPCSFVDGARDRFLLRQKIHS